MRNISTNRIVVCGPLSMKISIRFKVLSGVSDSSVFSNRCNWGCHGGYVSAAH